MSLYLGDKYRTTGNSRPRGVYQSTETFPRNFVGTDLKPCQDSVRVMSHGSIMLLRVEKGVDIITTKLTCKMHNRYPVSSQHTLHLQSRGGGTGPADPATARPKFSQTMGLAKHQAAASSATWMHTYWG